VLDVASGEEKGGKEQRREEVAAGRMGMGQGGRAGWKEVQPEVER
jgi:hypothetical protein